MNAARDGGRDREVSNAIGGAVRLYGPTVQARDVHGGIHVRTAPPPPPPTPRQLLPVTAYFTDRQDDQAALDHLVATGRDRGSGRPLIVVTGPAGIGKTTLVSHWLRRHEADFPDGQVYADLRGHTTDGPARPDEILGRFLRALGAGAVPTDPAEQASLWRSVTAGLRIAVMLDNAFTAAQIRPLLPGGTGGLVVVTSRRRMTGLRMDGAEFHQVRELGPDAGEELFIRGVGADRVTGELPAVRQVVSLCAGLPLAVCLASARLTARPGQPVAALADALAPDAGRLVALEVEGEATVRKALDASYAVLSPEAARMYRILGVLPLPAFDSRTAAAACAEPLDSTARRLDELVEANLLEDIGPDTYRFHDLVRVHARDRARSTDTAEAREQALRRVADWYLRTATEAQRLITPIQFTLPRAYAYPSPPAAPFTDDRGALGWLDTQRTNLMIVLRLAAERGWHATAWQLVDAMWPLFLRLRHYDLWIEAHRIGLDAARSDGHPEAERQMLNSGAIGLSAARRISDATEWYTASLAAAREAGDARDEGQALLGLGGCHLEAGDLDQAESHLDRAVATWAECGYPRGVALATILLGEVALARHAPERAAACFTRAREGLLAVADPHDAARALAFLGRARALAGDHDTGTARMEEALAVFTASGAAHWQARTLEMLADTAHEQGDDRAAEHYYALALTLYETTSPADARRLRES
ncbi:MULTISPECIES: ATP-binding protein [Streptomyces]|uniref:Regulatory protein AfsR n=1 Tax=Streptomyces chartreusis NRRL 3882 TaxID=1079985 RepID=A0A2N9B2N5_STRCX|nr:MULTISPECIES: tetratricopeptide repeat protein [Streptomyces]MYS93059.1 AAA family ATPase [Streptomyces sp. SID5464]SOR77584.1 Regulatory protein AfsR [Streptomyces chartreusis NRRL 3882]